MKSLCFVLSVVLLLLATVVFAQSDAPKPVAPSDAQMSFDILKSLAGSWEGRLTTVPQAAEVEGKLVQVSLRVTSLGHALMHELRVEGRPDNPITMVVVDGGRLLLTHYCDADNRPRMVGKMSADGKTVEFDFLDVTGNLQYGHMYHAVFTVIDENHHTEDWTWKQGGNLTRAHFDLHRKN